MHLLFLSSRPSSFSCHLDRAEWVERSHKCAFWRKRQAAEISRLRSRWQGGEGIKKRSSVEPQTFVNLKSNTMKNTMQKYNYSLKLPKVLRKNFCFSTLIGIYLVFCSICTIFAGDIEGYHYTWAPVALFSSKIENAETDLELKKRRLPMFMFPYTWDMGRGSINIEF